MCNLHCIIFINTDIIIRATKLSWQTSVAETSARNLFTTSSIRHRASCEGVTISDIRHIVAVLYIG